MFLFDIRVFVKYFLSIGNAMKCVVMCMDSYCATLIFSLHLKIATKKPKKRKISYNQNLFVIKENGRKTNCHN